MAWYDVTFMTVVVEAESEEDAPRKAAKLIAEDTDFFLQEVTVYDTEESDGEEE